MSELKQELLDNTEYEVLTPDGWSDFDGLLITNDKDIYSLNGYNLKCTNNHKILIENEFIEAKTLDCEYIGTDKVYDLVNVKKKNRYYTNDLVSHNCLYVDETAFIPNDMAFYESTYPTIASGKQSKIILTSTPNGTRGMFYKLWMESLAGKNSYVRKIVKWYMVPGRDEAWKRETINNSSAEQFRQEHDVEFRGSSNSLIPGDVLERLVKKPIIQQIEDVKVYYEPEENHSYVMTVDSSEGVGGDYHAITVTDISITPYQVVATYKNNRLSPLLLPNLIYNIATRYNDAIVLIENASSGGQIGSDLYYDLEYENTLMTVQEKGKQILGFSANGRIGVKTSKQVKSTGCSTIKTLIEDNKIELNDEDLIDEFGDFVPKGGSYAAAEGAHDDLVMTMVLFGWLTTQSYFVEMTDVNIRKKLFNDMVDRSEESMLPFGLIDDGQTVFDGTDTVDYDSIGSYGSF